MNRGPPSTGISRLENIDFEPVGNKALIFVLCPKNNVGKIIFPEDVLASSGGWWNSFEDCITLIFGRCILHMLEDVIASWIYQRTRWVDVVMM